MVWMTFFCERVKIRMGGIIISSAAAELNIRRLVENALLSSASAVILSPIASREQPRYRGEEEVCREENTDLRIFGKPSTKLNRRMGVVVGYEPHGSSLEALRERVCAAAAKVKVTE